MPKFVHLHAHSHYSLLDGLGKISPIIDHTKAAGMDALALTDHGVLYGAIEFYQAATAAGVKPIIGCEMYVAPNSRHSKTTADERPYHLILLAKNRTGYHNLLKLVTAAHLEGFYYKPRVDWELLSQHSEGLICTSACLQGEVAQAILHGDEALARQVVERYSTQFGADHYYLELQHHPSIPEQSQVNAAVRRLATEAGLPLVATNDAHYVTPDDAEAQDVLVCVQTGKLLSDTERMNMTGEDFSLKTPKEMAAWFSETPEALSNTARVAEMVDLELELGGMILPKFSLPKGRTARSQLRQQVADGINARYGAKPGSAITERVAYEMGVIEKMGFESYFLIVGDFVNYAKDNGILVGPGRGSGAGSIVAYALRITNLDPIAHGLLFERFLNPDRISMPDFDIDFADDRRGEVIRYVQEKYGHDHVAQIITFGTLGAKAAVRDTGRVLGMGYGQVDQVAKLIPNRPGTLLADARRQPDLQELERSDPEVKRLLDLAAKLEGVCRHASTHAAGVVIGDQPLVNYVPLQQATRGDTSVITQYSMWPIEAIGLLKMDFLGLSNLTILRNSVEIIQAVHGQQIDIDALPLDDPETFKLLSAAQTYGVFQLESDGMRRYIRELKPSRFEDIVAMVALYRPGPMQFIDSFIRRKHGREAVRYIHPKVKHALEETYGVIVYQEQVMQISKDLAGFSGGEADTLRKAMGKKIAALMATMRQKFIDGVVASGESKQLGETLFNQFEEFAQYGFNKAHAACYALIAYQTAYLKAHYPSAFMAALLTSEQDNLDKLTATINECEQMGIKVLPPDINESFASFAVAPDKQSIRFGLDAIKNVGRNTVEAVITSRKQDGPFQTITDFLNRLPDGATNKKSLEALIKAGALDSLAERGQLLAGLEAISRYAARRAAESRSGQTNLFGDSSAEAQPLTLPPASQIDQRQKLEWERELLGMYVSEHPLSEYANYLRQFTPLAKLAELREGQATKICGLVVTTKRITTRKGEPMAFVTLEDTHRQGEVIVFPKLYNEVRGNLEPGTIVVVAGKVSRKDDAAKLLADSLHVFDPQAAATVATIDRSHDLADDAIEDLDDSRDDQPADLLTIELNDFTTLETLEQVKDILQQHHGESPVQLVLRRGHQERRLKLAHSVRYSQALVDALQHAHDGVSVARG